MPHRKITMKTIPPAEPANCDFSALADRLIQDNWHLPAGGAVFLASLIAGQPLGEAAALALEASPSFDIASSLAGTIEAGAFTASTLEKQDGQ